MPLFTLLPENWKEIKKKLEQKFVLFKEKSGILFGFSKIFRLSIC
jgi:hypothetical protein